jgi:hypothetical protein
MSTYLGRIFIKKIKSGINSEEEIRILSKIHMKKENSLRNTCIMMATSKIKPM